VIRKLEINVNEAKDNLIATRLSQTIQANNDCTDDFSLKTDDRVLLSTLHRRQEYKSKGAKCVAKFMPCFDGPYSITAVNHVHSTVTLDLPNKPHVFPTFHMSQIIPFIENDDTLFPSRKIAQPPPLIINEEEEYFVDRILDECKCGCGMQYLVCWTGYGPEDDRWLLTSALKDCKVMDIWLAWRLGSST
jgi:hypothetical protein